MEASVLVVGWLLGGTLGIGTVVHAFGIGPLVQLLLRLALRSTLLHDFGVQDSDERDRARRTRITTMSGCPAEKMQPTPTC